MPLKTFLINEKGEKIEQAPNTFFDGRINFAAEIEAELARIFEKNKSDEKEIQRLRERYPLLSTIDPYGDTYVNIYQAPLFIKELNQLKAETNNIDVKRAIDGCINFLGKITNHVYVKFEGD